MFQETLRYLQVQLSDRCGSGNVDREWNLLYLGVVDPLRDHVDFEPAEVDLDDVFLWSFGLIESCRVLNSGA